MGPSDSPFRSRQVLSVYRADRPLASNLLRSGRRANVNVPRLTPITDFIVSSQAVIEIFKINLFRMKFSIGMNRYAIQ